MFNRLFLYPKTVTGVVTVATSMLTGVAAYVATTDEPELREELNTAVKEQIEECGHISMRKENSVSIPSFNSVEMTEEERLETANTLFRVHETLEKEIGPHDLFLFFSRGAGAGIGNRVMLNYRNIFPESYCEKLGITHDPINDGVLYHEIGHIKNNDSMRGLMLYPLSVGLGCYCLMKGHYKILASYIFTNNVLRIQYQEYRADMYAAKRGYGQELIESFERDLEINKTLGWLRITQRGNDLFDYQHPFITRRIKYIKNAL